MSDGDDDFLARWSRRKRMARSIGGRTSLEEAGVEEARVEEAGAADATASAVDADPQPMGIAPAGPELPEPLPSLEDLTADSDLAAFLREGVPPALKNAAMRRMWSLDPAIRDYVGPAEYAWDFNQPGSMAGFGALEPGRSAADLLSTMSRTMPSDATRAAVAPRAPASPPRQPADAAPEEADPFSPAEAVRPREPAAEPRQPAADVAVAGESVEEPRLEKSPGSSPRPRHGGALPR